MQRRKVESPAKGEEAGPPLSQHDNIPNKMGKGHHQGTTRQPTVLMALGMVTLLIAVAVFVVPSETETPADTKDMARFRRRSEKKKTALPSTTNATTTSASSQSVEYKLVFSTGCSLYQDWQSYVFFYQAMVTQQPGTVTRIVSGCSQEDEAALRKIFDEQIRPMAPHDSDRFQIHFTPDYSMVKGNGKPFVYFNKPFGMRHWMQHALGFSNNKSSSSSAHNNNVNDDAIIILLDPDQLILRPFANNNFTNTQWKFLEKDETPAVHVTHGHPMGQLYGFGLQWKNKINMSSSSGLLKTTTTETSPVTQLSMHEARKGYIVGPPYIATGTLLLLLCVALVRACFGHFLLFGASLSHGYFLSKPPTYSCMPLP